MGCPRVLSLAIAAAGGHPLTPFVIGEKQGGYENYGQDGEEDLHCQGTGISARELGVGDWERADGIFPLDSILRGPELLPLQSNQL